MLSWKARSLIGEDKGDVNRVQPLPVIQNGKKPDDRDAVRKTVLEAPDSMDVPKTGDRQIRKVVEAAY